MSAGWPNRPFQVEWNPGDQFVLEVYDRKTGLFVEPRRFTPGQPDPAAHEFPLKSGDFPLEPAQKPDPPVDPRPPRRLCRASVAGESVARSPTAVAEPQRAADRPIVIK